MIRRSPVALAFLIVPLLASLAPAVTETVQPAPGYIVFGPQYSPVLCELPKSWRLRSFPRPSQKGEHILFTAMLGPSATLAAASYDDTHAKFPNTDRYLKTQAKGLEVTRVVVGRNRRLARRYERKTAKRRDVFVLLPRINTPLYCVLRYSATPESFDRHYPAFQHMLDTWLFRFTDTGSRGGH